MSATGRGKYLGVDDALDDAVLYDCCEHCEHDINDPPHEIPCPDGCGEWSEDG